MLAGVAALAGCGDLAAVQQQAPQGARVTRVVDGDTLRVRVDAGGGERVRLIGIDTPELRPPECFGDHATRALERLVARGRVTLQRDREARDPYGRLLAYVRRDGEDVTVNELLVLGGFARARRYPPNTALASRFEAAQAVARREGRGLWGACKG